MKHSVVLVILGAMGLASCASDSGSGLDASQVFTFQNTTSTPVGTGDNEVMNVQVSGLDNKVIREVRVLTTVESTFGSDVILYLRSPANTQILLTNGNGGFVANAFSQVTWDEFSTNSASDFSYSGASGARNLSPEARLRRLVGEAPNGEWDLVVEHAGISGNPITVTNFALEIEVVDAGLVVPVDAHQVSNGTDTAIPDNGGTLVIPLDAQAIQGVVCGITSVEVQITHPCNSDLRLVLRSPNGTDAVLSSGNGSCNDNGYSNSTFSDILNVSAASQVTFPANAAVAQMAPELGFMRFIGESITGIWQLRITDSQAGNDGDFSNVELNINTCAD